MPQAPSFSVVPQSRKENEPPVAGFSTRAGFFLPGSRTAARLSRQRVQTLPPLSPLNDVNYTPEHYFYAAPKVEHGLLTPQTPSNHIYTNFTSYYGAPSTASTSAPPNYLDNRYQNTSQQSSSTNIDGILFTAPNTGFQDSQPPLHDDGLAYDAISPDQSDAELPSCFSDQGEISASFDDRGSSGSQRKKYTSKEDTVAAAHQILKQAQITPTMFLIHILEAAQQRTSAQVRIGEAFFRESNEGNICRLLDLIMDNYKGAATLKEWMRPHAVDLVCDTIHKEMEAAKPSLRLAIANTTPEFIDSWNINEIMDPIAKNITPTWTRVLKAATQPKGSVALDSEEAENIHENRHTTQNVISAQCHYRRSYRSCKVQIGLGLMAWSTGASRSLLNVLHKAGLAVSYGSLTTTVAALRDHSLRKAATISRKRHVLTYDNFNASASPHYEQRPGAMSKVQSGTFPVLYDLGDVNPEHMKLAPLTENLKNSKPLMLEDLRPAENSKYAFQTYVNIAKILFKYSNKFDFVSSNPGLQHIPRHPRPAKKTYFYPLCVSTIEEATVTGNLQVHDNIYIDQLHHNPCDSELNDYAIPSLNDQLTNARIRGAQTLRLKDANSWERREVLQLAFGTFHLVMNLLWAILHTYKGTAGQDGSLSNYFALLEKARLCNDHPEYYPLLAALTQIIEGLIFNAWRAECGHESVDAFAASKPTPDDILRICRQIVKKYATPRHHVVRTEAPTRKRKSGDTNGDDATPTIATPDSTSSETDHVHANTILLTRDLLYVVELIDAISTGDFGRIEDILPEIACVFRGAGSNNYSMEILHFLFNVKEVWTPEFANIMRDVMLINPTGLEGRNMPIDLNIEHLIGQLKVLFMSKGIYSSWDRLGDISAAINYLHRIKNQVTTSLDSGYQGSTHTKPDTSVLVMRVANRARELKFQERVINRKTRTANDKETKVLATSVPDLHRVGYRKFESGTLESFNGKIKDYKDCIFAGAEQQGRDDEVDELPPVSFERTSVEEETALLFN